jgi:serine/threonine-protein kinase
METACHQAQALPLATTVLGHYHIRRKLGEGGFGQVFEAWDSLLCRSIAIKQLKGMPAAAPPERLIREGRLAAALRHPAFVQVFAVDGDGITQSIIMEMVQGDTLHHLLEQRALSIAQALDIIDRVAEAMTVAHESGLVHGDLKPSNLIIEPAGTPRIVDFGLAREIDPLMTQSGAGDEMQGTIAYMAPERLAGQVPDVAADIYALGTVLYEMIAGSRPYANLHGLALAAAHLQSSSAQWPFPAGTDPAIVALVLAMTARVPVQRLPSMLAVRASLQTIRGGVATPNRLWHRRAARHRRWAAPALAVLALALGWLLQTDWRAGLRGPHDEARLMQQGMQALRSFDREGSLDTAAAAFSGVLAHNQKQAAAAAGLSLADSLRYIGDGRDPAWLARADAAAQQALRLDDQLALAHVARGEVQRMAGHFPEATLAYGRALALDPRNVMALAGKANLLIATERWVDAARLLRGAMDWYPRERRFADLLGTLHYQQGDYRAAEAAFRLSLKLDPDTVFAYANLNAALLRQGRPDEALQVLQQGLQVRPNGRLYSNLGTTLFARGDYGGAAQAFERALSDAKGSPNDYLKWANLGDALRWIPGRDQAAQSAYRRAADLLGSVLARAPGDAARLSRMGLYSARLGQYAAALKWNARAIALAPTSPDTQFRAALVFELASQRAAAITALAQAQALGYPSNLIVAEPDLIALRRDSRYQHLSSESKR